MSEAILHALDAPYIVNVSDAIQLVEQYEDSTDAPTANIAEFFNALLQIWPEDGSQGAVWYEDFTYNKPAGKVLAMTFNLDEFNEKTLSTLRELAGRHALHILDLEGEVLYLSNGSEMAGFD